MKAPILLDLPDELVGDRVIVRPFKPGDGPAMEEAVNASLDHLKPWMPWAHREQTSDDFEERARIVHARWILREDMAVGIWTRDGSRMLGGSGLHRIDWEVRKFEIGYWIRPDEEGKGLMTEAVSLLCGLAFGLLEANRVHICCASYNLRSAAIPKRLGFAYEGTLKQDRLSTTGDLYDLDIYGMTRPMWEASLHRRSR